ncbi:MAG: SGNH/GDSL hydrolase family protein [Planctomycetota bacterium]
MKYKLFLLPWMLILCILGCNNGGGNNGFVPTPSSQEELVLRKFVVIGDSLSSGYQSGGLSEEFQINSYPNQMARQMGKESEFEQPIVNFPGIGGTLGRTPLRFENGIIFDEPLLVDPFSLLDNITLTRPYDNLGIPGAALFDTQNTLFDSSNPFFEVVLRNPLLGNSTQLEQALDLNPSLLVVWIGNNDILASATNGGDVSLITPTAQFQNEYSDLLTEIRDRTGAFVVLGNIPNVTDIPFVNALDGIFRTDTILGPTPVPVVFDTTFTPVDFGAGLYIPLLTTESNLAHVLISGLGAYQSGIGIPDQTALEGYGFNSLTAAALVAGMQGAGLITSGIALPGTTTMTVSEETAISNAEASFNTSIQSLALQFNMPVVDLRSSLTTLNSIGIEGFTGNYVLQDPINTAFSLDGVHANNAGYAIIANLLITAINDSFSVNIPLTDPEIYRGQYASGL